MTGPAAFNTSKRLVRVLEAAPTAHACLDVLGEPDLARDLPAEVTHAVLLTEARHQADLLAYPYIGPEHVRLAALRLLGRRDARLELHTSLPPGLPDKGWRPRGPLSAARRRGRSRAAGRQVEAAAAEQQRPWPGAT